MVLSINADAPAVDIKTSTCVIKIATVDTKPTNQ
jgi:hypothetical protein